MLHFKTQPILVAKNATLGLRDENLTRDLGNLLQPSAFLVR